MTDYKHAPVEVFSWSDLRSNRVRQKKLLIRPSKTEVSTDQAQLHSKHLRSKLCLVRSCQTQITSDQTEIRQLSRRFCDRGPDQTQTIVRTILRSKIFLIRLLSARISLLTRRLCARNCSDQTQLRSKYSDQLMVCQLNGGELISMLSL